MATFDGSDSDYALHPEGGRFRGHIKEVVDLGTEVKKFPSRDKPGETDEVMTTARLIVIENCDGHHREDIPIVTGKQLL